MNKQTLPQLLLPACALAFLTGCVGTDSVLFVTTTNIGIDADTRPPNATIGYDRYEGYFGPVYESGAIPPVVARLESNLSVFSPQLRQVYATGDAARLVTTDGRAAVTPKPLTGDKRVAFFGTGTAVGLKVTFTANAPESISLGYKRKEFSYIPIIETPAGDVYGSVLASIDLNVNTPSLTNTALGVSQFFATGVAAEQLARDNAEIRRAFQKEAEQAVTLVRATFVKDEAGALLRRATEEDPEFVDDLKAWIERNNLRISTTLLIYGKEYADQRQAAVDELLTPR